MSSITQQLLEATDIIASREAKQVSFDQTILCTVVQPTIENEEDMCYVSNGTIKFKAKNATGNKLSKNTSVYVVVPSGDYSNEKIIIATYKEEEADNYKQIYADITQDFIQAEEYSLPNDKELELSKNSTTIVNSIYNIYNYSFSNNRIYFENYDRVILKAKFNINAPDLVSGEYIVRASFLDSSHNELWYGEIGSKEILGNPYTINELFEQEAIFTTDVIIAGEEGQETKQLNFDLVTRIQIKLYTPQRNIFVDKNGEEIDWQITLKDFKILLGYHKANFIANHGNIENGLVKIVLVDNTGKEISDTKDILTPYYNSTYNYNRYFGINYVTNSKILVLNPLDSNISWRRYNPTLEDVWGEILPQVGETDKYFKGEVKTNYNSSQFKAVYENISSNIIKISKNDKDFEASIEDTLIYDVEDNNYNLVYPIYDQADEVVSSGIKPKIIITGFKNSYGELKNNKVPMTIRWKIPAVATMIQKPTDLEYDTSTNKKRTWSDGSSGYYVTSYSATGDESFWDKLFELQVSLKNSFSDGATNNTIICQIIRDDEAVVTYQAKITLHPTRVGTTGEDFGLVITPDRTCLTNKYIMTKNGVQYSDLNDGRMVLTASLKQLSTGSDLTDDYDEQYWYDNLTMEFVDGAFGNIDSSCPYDMNIKKIGVEGISKRLTTITNGQNDSDVIMEQFGDVIRAKYRTSEQYTALKNGVDEIPVDIKDTPKAARSYMVRIFEYLTTSYFCIVKATFKLRNGRKIIAYQSIPRNYSESYTVAFEGPARLVYDSFGKLRTNIATQPYKVINGDDIEFPNVGIWYPGIKNENWRNPVGDWQINQYNWVKENTNPPSIKRSLKEDGKYSYQLVPTSSYPRSKITVASLIFFPDSWVYKDKDENETIYSTLHDKNGNLLSPEEAVGSLPSDVWRYIYPIVIIQDTHFNDTIDAWDGTISQEDETGMVLATAFAAGKKDNATNTFTGIIMGETSGAGNGLFGYSGGKNTFGFKEDGSCWLGANKNIQFDAKGEAVKIEVNSLAIKASKNSNYLEINSDDAKFCIGKTNGNKLEFNKDGKGELNITGKIYASAGGTIGGWEIGAKHLGYQLTTDNKEKYLNCFIQPSGSDAYYTINGYYSKNWAMTFGLDSEANGNFGILKNGHLYAKEAYISGTITASTFGVKANEFSGIDGGWYIEKEGTVLGSLGSSRLIGYYKSGTDYEVLVIQPNVITYYTNYKKWPSYDIKYNPDTLKAEGTSVYQAAWDSILPRIL